MARGISRKRVSFVFVLFAPFVAALGLSAPARAQDAAQNRVEVMHWLTADRDAAALGILRKSLIASGGSWIDSPMPGAGEVGRAAAVSRILGGNPPAVFQFSLGAQLGELASGDLLIAAPVDSALLDTVLPQAVARVSRFNNRLIAAPLDIRGENWMFYNAAVLRAADVGVPRTWPEFLRTARTLQSKGKLPIAMGGQAWQERILFSDVVLGVGGVDFYRRVFESKDQNAIRSPVMLEVFRTFGELRGFVDGASVGRRWIPATNMLIRGQAAFQFMGDWVKGEIIAAGLKPGREIGCALAPSVDEAYVMQVDAFVFARTAGRGPTAGQKLFGRIVMDRNVQAAFARRLGAIPARLDTPKDGFDECSNLAMRVVRNPRAQLLDNNLSLPGGLSGAIDDAISQFWSDRSIRPEQGRALFLSAFRSFK